MKFGIVNPYLWQIDILISRFQYAINIINTSFSFGLVKTPIPVLYLEKTLYTSKKNQYDGEWLNTIQTTGSEGFHRIFDLVL